MLIDDNCRPLEHFNYFFLIFVIFCKMDSKLKTCTKPNRQSVHHPRAPSPLYSSSSFLSCFVESKVKGLKISGRTQLLSSQALTFKAQGDTRLTARFGVLLIVIYLFCLLSYDILFSVCIKQDLEKQHNTSPHFYLFYFSYQNLGRRNYIFAQLLVTKCYKCYQLF